MNRRLLSYTSAIIWLLLIPLTWQHPQPSSQYLAIGLVAVSGLSWLIAKLRSVQPMAVPRLALPFALFIVWQAVLIQAAPVPAYSLHDVVTSLLAFLGFLFMVEAMRSNQENASWGLTFLLIGIVFISVDLFYMLGWYQSWTRISGEMFSSPPFMLRAPGLLLGHPNLFAAYLNLFVPLVIVRAVRAQKARRIAWLFFLAVLLVMIFFTSSRSAWLGLAGSLAVTLGLLFIPSWLQDRNQGASRKMSKRHLLVIGAALALILFFWPILRRQVQSTAHGTYTGRATIWIYGLKLISASPIWGHGPGSTPFLYALRSEEVGGDEMYYTHNIGLQIAVTTGLVGLGLALWMAVEIIKAFSHAWRNTPLVSSDRDSLVAYAGIGAGIAIHGLLDYFFNSPIFTLSVMFILACIYLLAPQQAYFTVGRKRSLVAAAAMILVCLAGMLACNAGAAQYWAGVIHSNRGERQAAQESLCQAAQANPGRTYYSFQCSLASAYLAFESNDTQALEALTSLQRSTLASDPYWYLHWANLATYEWRLGNREQAINHMRRAVEMAPRLTWLQLNLGWMEEQLGREDSAAVYYRNILCSSPWYRDSPFFKQTSLRRQALQSECPREQDTLSNSPLDRYSWNGWVALKSGDLEAAVQAFERAIQTEPRASPSYALLGLAHQQAGNDEQAWKDIQTAIFVDASSARVFFAAAQVAYSQGKEEQAIEYLSTAYNLMTYSQTSWRYYFAAYNQIDPPSDVSPYFVRTGLPPDLQEQLLQWVAYLEREGDFEKAQEVRQWIKQNSAQ